MANSRSQKKQSPKAGTAAGVKQYEQKRQDAAFKKSVEKIQRLVDSSDSFTRTSNYYTKQKLRDFLRYPTRHSKDLRDLSRYLYYRSQVYRRLIQYNASMINLNYRSVVPLIDPMKEVNQEEQLKSFANTSRVLESMNLSLEFYKAYTIAWREDVFYGCAYHDKTGFFILPLDPDFCKITGIFKSGDLAFEMDMSYFDSRSKQLQMWGDPFVSMYRKYKSTMDKWQPLPDKNTVCLKVNIDDWELPLPPYMGLFDNLINLEDLADIMAIAERQQIDKMIVAEVPLKKNSDAVDDFAVDLNTAIAYYNKMIKNLPDYVSSIITPIPLDTIKFDRDQATDVSKLENATKSILTISGGIQTLCPPEGTTAYTAAIRSDEEYAISSLLPQTESIINRLIAYQISHPAKVKLLEVTRYTKDEYKAQLIKDMNYGAPHILTLSSLAGFSEIETISMAHLQKAVDVETLFKPLQTAATQSNKNQPEQSSDSKEPGRPEHGVGEKISDEGEKSVDKRDRRN